MTCSFNGGIVDYKVYGNGKNIVFLHGFLEDDSIWNTAIEYFSASYKIFTINLPGNSKSSMPCDTFSMNMMADCVNEVLKNEQTSDALLIGHSMGGYVSLAFADRYFEKCKGIALINSTSYADSEQKQKDRDRAIKIIQNNKAIFINEAIPNLFAKNNLNRLKNEIEILKQNALQMPVAAITACLKGMKNRKDYSTRFAKSELPLLFMAGKHDNVIPFDKSIEQKNITAQTYFVEMQHSGHMSFLEEKEKFCYELSVFLKTVYK